MPRRQPRNDQRTRMELGFERGEERLGNHRLGLVLDRHMRPPARLILRDEHCGKRFGKVATRLFKRVAANAISNAVTKRHQTIDHCRRRWRAGFFAQATKQFSLTRRRQMMKQRQMRAQDVAFGRKMRATLAIKPSKIGVTKQRRNDNRRDCQIST